MEEAPSRPIHIFICAEGHMWVVADIVMTEGGCYSQWVEDKCYRRADKCPQCRTVFVFSQALNDWSVDWEALYE